MSLTCGKNRESVGPVLSALNIRTAPLPKRGNSAIKITIIPKPPNQCVKDRHKIRLCGKDSISSITVAPVPERPEIVSTIPSKTDK